LLAGTGVVAPGGPTRCPRDPAGKLDFSKSKSPPDTSSNGDGVNDAWAFEARLSAAGVRIDDACPSM
jgi:hypothetical protein